MDYEKRLWLSIVEKELKIMASEGSVEAELAPLTLQKPPKEEMGDLAFPLFAYAKLFKTAPEKIALELKKRIENNGNYPKEELLVFGGYLNVKVDLNFVANRLIENVIREKENFGNGELYKNKRIMVEFSCPNTNKPLHLGHLRNDAIGQSISSILKANGAEVLKVNLINNRGIHICKSMLAYQMTSEGETPASSGIKGDHLVGKYYVRFNELEKEDPTIIIKAQQMLKKWEEGDVETLKLWQQMNDWTMEGLKETYEKTAVEFDYYFYESETYALGKDKVLQGLKEGIFYREKDGSIWIDLEDIGLDKKVLLRSDGTSLYLTQDIGTAIERHNMWPFDSQIYVVASEQSYHFKVLFHVLEKLGYHWAKDLHHLAYGMVNLPDGKMKSREGTVVDADDLIEQLTLLAIGEIKEKEREAEIENVNNTAQAIALGALNYYLLQVNPFKDMIFNPDESISFNGNTGPYLQYMGARISSMIRKFSSQEKEFENVSLKVELLNLAEERSLIKLASEFPLVVQQAAEELNPSIISTYLYDLSRLFSRYYHDYPILKAPSKELIKARYTLVKVILQVFRNSYALLGIPFLESM
ncbi:MAG: arginine--tRNA ligase [Sphaerochaetaceae bacterium]